MKMPFGKYKDEDLMDVPIEYIKWLEQQNIDEELRKELNSEIDRRSSPVTSKGRDVVILPRAQELRVKEYHNYLLGRLRKNDFVGKTLPEIESFLKIWLNQYLDKFERVE